MRRSPEYPRSQEWLRTNEPFRRDVLARFRDVLARFRDAGPKQVRHDVDDEVQALASWLGSSCVADRALRPPPLGLTAQ